MRERLAEARRGGCDLAVVTTQPGSNSQQSTQRQGFALLYVRAILIKSIVQGYGGTITASNPAEGGACFDVRLPQIP